MNNKSLKFRMLKAIMTLPMMVTIVVPSILLYLTNWHFDRAQVWYCCFFVWQICHTVSMIWNAIDILVIIGLVYLLINTFGQKKKRIKMAGIKMLLQKARQNALLSAMIIGAIGYEVFAHTECLFPIGDAIGPWLPEWLPVGLFLLLYFTFCKIKKISDQTMATYLL